MLCSIIKTRVLIATKQSCPPAGAELSAAWVSLIRLPFLSLEHHLSRFLNKCSLCLGCGNFQQKLRRELGRLQQGSGESRQAAGEGRRRCSHSAASEVLAAAELGLHPQNPRREQGWGWRGAELGGTG